MSSGSRPNPQPSRISTESPLLVDGTSSSNPVADRIASCALEHYHNELTKKAKPKHGQEWTVFAAIVAFHRADDRMWVVSSATGTKCTAQRHNEFIIHDSHAEVLARRGLIRILLGEIKERQLENSNGAKKHLANSYLLTESENCSDRNLNSTDPESASKVKQYRLSSDITIHLYISDSPCGDASIYPVPSTPSRGNPENSNIRNGNEILYTGAKVIVSTATKVNATDCGGKHQLLASDTSTRKEEDTAINNKGPVVAREEVQSLGKLRTKSGRSNLPAHMRSHSHSCSDKIVLWSVLGLQGALLTKYLNPPVVPLTSVVVSIDSRLLAVNSDSINEARMHHHQQQIALERAIPNRVRNVWESVENEPSWKPQIPTVHIVRKVYESGKAAMIASSESKQISGKKRKHDECSKENEEKSKVTSNSKKAPPCGMSFNWNEKEGLEVIVGSRGIIHGKKPKSPQDIEKLSSRLSRAKLMLSFSSLTKSMSPGNEKSYFEIKNEIANSEWSNLKNRILTQNDSPLAGWLRCIKVDGDSKT